MELSFFHKKVKNQSKKILLVSLDEKKIDKISEILVLKGYDDLIKLNLDLLDLSPEEISKFDIGAVIVYAKDSANYEEYAKKLNGFFTKDVAKIILSHSDSIKIYQFFDKLGINYLNWDYQFLNITEKLSENTVSAKHKSIRIGILSAKGGVGGSIISYNIAKNIRNRYLSPTLLFQGNDSSFTIDYFAEKSFEKELILKDSLSFYKESKEDIDETLEDKFNAFNFIVFDYPIFSLDKDEIENVLNKIDVGIVVLDFDPSSIRKTKEIVKINDFLKTVDQGVKRLFLCLNNHRKTSIGLDMSSLKDIIGKNIDITLPYKKINILDSKNISLKNIDKLVDLLVSEKERNTSFFSKLFTKR